MTSYTTVMTSNKISAVLQKAGYNKSDSSTTSVRGWYNITSGYEVREDAEVTYGVHAMSKRSYIKSKTIKGWTVSYTTGTSPLSKCTVEGYQERAHGYESALSAAGITCEYREDSYGAHVWVPMQPKVEKPSAKAEKAEVAEANRVEADLNVMRGYIYHKLHRAGYAKDVKVEVVDGKIRISVREGHEFEMYNAHDILARNFIVEYVEHNTVLIISR